MKKFSWRVAAQQIHMHKPEKAEVIGKDGASVLIYEKGAGAMNVGAETELGNNPELKLHLAGGKVISLRPMHTDGCADNVIWPEDTAEELITGPDYEPKTLVENIEKIEEDEWLKYRTYGIGGSDCATVMGDNPWNSPKGLYWNKKGKEDAMVPEEEDNWIAKEVGHRLEDLVIKIFAEKNPGWRPYVLRQMFYNPKHPFMLADCDGFVQNPNTGEIYILEIKTTDPDAMQMKWGGVNDTLIPANYQWQGRHYMAVTGCAGVIFCALSRNNESGYRQRLMLRDLSLEKELIETEEEFWRENILKDVEPEISGDPEKEADRIKKHYGVVQGGVKELREEEAKKALKNYLEASNKRRELERSAKQLKERENEELAKLLDMLEGSSGIVELGEEAYEIRQTVSAKKSIPVSSIPALNLAFGEEAMEPYIKVSESVRTSVKKCRKMQGR